MKIVLLVVGKTDASYLREGISEYLKRIEHYIPFEMKHLPDIKGESTLSPEQRREREGELILDSCTPSDCVVLFDERGKSYTSLKFADYLNKKMGAGLKRLLFVVGGPYGFSEGVYERADEKISLSEMTFSHQMVRLIIVEQIYRAMTILKGEPYHHE